MRLVFDLAEELPAAVADPTQLELAVLNLAIMGATPWAAGA